MSKEAKPDAWMPLYIGDWDGDTGHLDCEQDGAYGRLIRWYWRNGPIPDDDGSIARIIRMDLKRWRKIRPVLAAFFTVADGVWRHGRADKERERWAERKVRFAERAAAGGKAKAAKSTASSTPKAVLAACTSSSSREVEGSIKPSTLSGRERPEARPDGASGLRVVEPSEPEDTARAWLLDAKAAEEAEFRCRRSDPDQASELAEFIAVAKARATQLRRNAA